MPVRPTRAKPATYQNCLCVVIFSLVNDVHMFAALAGCTIAYLEMKRQMWERVITADHESVLVRLNKIDVRVRSCNLLPIFKIKRP